MNIHKDAELDRTSLSLCDEACREGCRMAKEAITQAEASAEVDWVPIKDSAERSVVEVPREGIHIKPPQNLSWQTVGTLVVAFVTIIVNGATFYIQQNNFNKRMSERMDAMIEYQKETRNNTYNKREMDLQLDKIQVHQDILRKDLDELENDVKGRRR